uniref:V-set and transmembrane domain-containing protein 2-like protein n=1 Tax=Meleagris gallopavo TaxID=9103 RepID=G1MX85_MELGA
INFSVMLIISRVLMGSTTAAPALFTETPHDVTAQAGEDVEMACSFRGSGSPSYSLEIQWWYVRTHKDWTDKQTWASGQLKASHQEEAGKDATKISVVKVVGSNISHKLRLSRVKPADEGTYECRVIDASEGSARQHKVKAYLRVESLYIDFLLCLLGTPVMCKAPVRQKPHAWTAASGTQDWGWVGSQQGNRHGMEAAEREGREPHLHCTSPWAVFSCL